MIVSDCKIRYHQDIVSGLDLRLKICMERLRVKAVRCLDFHHMLDRLLLGMCHRHFRRLILETVDHTLQARDLLLLRSIILHELAVILLLALHEVRIIARIAGRCTVLDLINHINNVIKEHSVMGYDNDCLRVAFQITFQPLDCRDIQVVRRLVEKQDVRFAEKQLDECNLRLLPTGKLRQRLLALLFGETELADQDIVFLLEIISAVLLELLL